MARLATIGCEQRSNTAGVEWDSVTGAARITYDTSIVLTGTVSMKVVGSNAASTYVERVVRSTNGVLFYQFPIYIAGFPTDATGAILQALTTNLATCAASIGIRTDNKLELFDGNIAGTSRGQTSALSTNTWYIVELKVQDGGTPELELRVSDTSGNLISSVTGAMTATGGVGAFDLGMADFVSNFTAYFNHIIVNDSTGVSENTWVGNQRVIRRDATASGDVNTFATQTGGTAGAANNFTRIDETTPNDATDFNGSSTLNEEDLMTVAAIGLNSYDTVTCVEVWGRFRNSTADTTAALRFEIEKTASGTKTQSSNIVPNSTTWRTNVIGTTVPKIASIIAYADPDGAAWSPTSTSIQVGYKLQVAPGTGGRRIDVTSVFLYLSYTPGTPPSGGNVVIGYKSLMGVGM